MNKIRLLERFFGKKPEPMYTEADIISFGQFLLSKERERKIRKYEKDAEAAAEKIKTVHSADLCNWKHMRGR